MRDSNGMVEKVFESDMLLIGCGNMAGAMLNGWLAAGVSPGNFTICDPMVDAVPDGTTLLRSTGELPQQYDMLLLGVKPQMLDQVADDVRSAAKSGAVIISILAGVQTEHLQSLFPKQKILRLMPNLSAALGLSPLGLWSAQLSQAERDAMSRLLSPLGSPEWLESEKLMDAFTALAGSGPAFVYRFIDALSAGGAATGLPEEQAQRIALQMTLGAAQLAADADASPGELADRVASPGGTTAAGLAQLDEGGAISALLRTTLRAARDRGAELAKEAAVK